MSDTSQKLGTDEMIEKLCKKYANISDEAKGRYDWEVGCESTADGYELWYCKEYGYDTDICENVYYYESGVIDKLQEIIVEVIDDETKISILCWDESISDQIDWEHIAGEVESNGRNEGFINALAVITESDDDE